jgi:methylglutaconyl-CoA hydratase
MYQFLTTRRDGPVEYLTLNRPDVRNAFNEDVIAELADWAARTGEAAGRAGRARSPGNNAVRVVVLSGAGKAFSAGADAAWMAKAVRYSEAENLRDATASSRMFAALDALPVALVGQIHGGALGGGAGLAAVCDVAIAEEQTQFGFTEVTLGIVPAVISPFVLAKIGRSAARELFVTGARFSAARAREIGLVHAVVPASDLDETVARYVNDILAAGPEAVAAVKVLIRDVAGRTVEDAMGITARAIAARRVSAEGQEGLKAFLEKRKPDWK